MNQETNDQLKEWVEQFSQYKNVQEIEFPFGNEVDKIPWEGGEDAETLAELIMSIKSEASLRLLKKAMQSNDISTKRSILRGCAKASGDQAVQFIKEYCNDQKLKSVCIDLLAEIKNKSACLALFELSDDPENADLVREALIYFRIQFLKRNC